MRARLLVLYSARDSEILQVGRSPLAAAPLYRARSNDDTRGGGAAAASRLGSRRGAQGERRLAVVVIAFSLGDDGVQQAAEKDGRMSGMGCAPEEFRVLPC